MEKLFYTLEEAAQRLGKPEDHVRQLAASGQLEQFRDRDRLMFKKQQVDLLAGGEEEGIHLADSGELEPLGLAASGSATGINLTDSAAGGSTGPEGSSVGLKDASKEGTGITLADSEATDDADANAVTRVTTTPGALVDPGDEKSASGSGGLLDLTREADDTSLGAGLLEDVYGAETVASQTATEEGERPPAAEEASSLFENPAAAAGADSFDAAGAPVVVVATEVYDGAGSGLVGGLALGSILALGVAAFALIMAMTSTTTGGLLTTLGDNFMPVLGAAAGITLILAIVGWLIGKKS